MVLANELRIGNLVYNENKQIVSVSASRIVLCDDKRVKYQPIPLTEEWLVKFGFYQSKSAEYEGLCAYNIPSWGRVVIQDGTLQPDQYYFLDGLTQEIEYVHQLQNLYFALTGEELTFKN